MIEYSRGCAGSTGALGIRTTTTPFLGNGQFTYGLQGARPNSSAALYWALAAGDVPIQGCNFAISQITVAQPAQTDGTGGVDLLLAIPNVPTTLGVSLFTQWLVVDPGAPGLFSIGGAAMSHGVELRLGAP